VRRQAWVRLGADARVRRHCGRVRVVWVETPTAGTLRLATNLDPETFERGNWSRGFYPAPLAD